MKKAILYQKFSDGKLRCDACFHKCLIVEGKTGICGVRKNIKGELYLLVYGKAAAFNIDPVEKKPLFHFYPGSEVFSFGTFGCNFACDFCQNWDISQEPKNRSRGGGLPIEDNYWGESLPPSKIIEFCQDKNISQIAYTYNEPTIWEEYAEETMKLAKKTGMKNIWVSNGYMSERTLEFISPYLDAINVDLKSFSEEFYKEIVKAKLEPVKENIKNIWQKGIWEEVTTLVIPGLNDSSQELSKIAEFLVNISSDLPWHLSAFYPNYKMRNKMPTSQEILMKAYEIGKTAGLKYVYTGNIPDVSLESTYCPKCNELLIKRQGIEMIENNLKGSHCPKCYEKIAGRWG